MNCEDIYDMIIEIVCGLGLIGNGIAFCTFGKMCTQNASTFLFRALAVVDSFLLIMELLDIFLRQFQHESMRYKATLIYIKSPFIEIALTATIWSVVLVGLHRYIVVCKPLMVARLCTVGKARRHLCGVLLFSLMVNFPRFFVYVYDNDTDTWVTTNMGKSLWFQLAYDTVFHRVIVNYVIPVGSLIFITVRLLQSLRSSRQRRMELIEGQGQVQRDNRLECMVIVVLIVFLVCHTGVPIAFVLHWLGVDLGISCHLSVAFISYTIVMTLIVLNSSVNIIIYIVFYRNFRRILCPSLTTVTD